MMKILTRKPAARIASGNVSQKETARTRYIAYHNKAYGMKVLASCQDARQDDGA